MYKCHNCGAEFDEPKIIKDRVGEYWGVPAYQDLPVCPICEIDDLEEMQQCEFCEGWTVSTDGICDDCKRHVATSVMDLCDRLANDLGIGYYKAFMLVDDMMEDMDR